MQRGSYRTMSKVTDASDCCQAAVDFTDLLWAVEELLYKTTVMATSPCRDRTRPPRRDEPWDGSRLVRWKKRLLCTRQSTANRYHAP
ncbi:hypothetical protein DOTSEDRAFT_70665 [Dothistroma septosporum NZE10]|uniref:Uncharacterized protein n=1 Tax=Dothistroma septosporum (strain NZE10 / CBS 128990) TaxID=675120 RepID=N1PUW3_DOTSN|nr:hypothetical protein DOTSEDRAFT_70665 [Dothistroma septosporum NZE10]